MIRRRCWQPLVAAGALLLSAGITAGSLIDGDHSARIGELLEQLQLSNVSGSQEEVSRLLRKLDNLEASMSAVQRHQLGLIRARWNVVRGENEEARRTLKALLQEDLSTPHRLRALTLASNVSLHTGDYDSAFAHLDEGLLVADKASNEAMGVDIYHQAAYLSNLINQHQHAIDYAQRAIALADAENNPRDACYPSHQLAWALTEQRDFPRAEAALSNAQLVCSRTKDPIVGAALLALEGELLILTGEYEQAITSLQKGAQLHQEAGFRDGQLESQRFLAEALLSLGRIDEAYSLASNLIPNLQPQEHARVLSATQDILSRIHEQRGEFDQALQAQREAYAANARWEQQTREMETAFLHAQFDTRVREQELQLLRQQVQLQALEQQSLKQQQYLQRGGYLVAAFLGIVLLMILYHATRERRHFQRLSEFDSLTGILNHRTFFLQTQAMLNRPDSADLPGTLLMADIDWFKAFNDRHGHDAGDDAIRAVATQLATVMSKRDGIVGRVGGEEFAVFLPNTPVAEALECIAGFQEAFQGIVVDGELQPITLSVGVASQRADDTAESLRKRADVALYNAKHRGRNTIVVEDQE